MERIVWSEAWSVGVERIDAEHKTLVAMLDELGQALASGQGQEAVKRTAAGMRQYAQGHFRTEEDGMLATNYPGRTSHIFEHDAFIEKVLDLEEVMGQGGVVAAADLWSYLQDWLSEHIQGPDKILGAHLCAFERS